MKNRFLPLILSVLLTIALILLIEDFVQRVIVNPVLHVVWLVTLFLGSINQAVYWALFIILALIIARRSFKGETAGGERVEVRRLRGEGAVARWSTLLKRAENRDYSKWRLAQAFHRLSREILFPRIESELGLDNEEEDDLEAVLPPEILAYLQSPMPASEWGLLAWFRRRTREPSKALDLDPERVVAYLENRLES